MIFFHYESKFEIFFLGGVGVGLGEGAKVSEFFYKESNSKIFSFSGVGVGGGGGLVGGGLV